MADRTANGRRFISLVKLTTCVAAACSSFGSRAGDLPELSGSLVAYSTVSISIPDPLPLATLPTLPGSDPEASNSAVRESGLTRALKPEAPGFLNPPEPASESSLEKFSLTDERQLEGLLKALPREARSGSEEFVLLRKRMPSRYAYDSWANVQTGFGRFFPDEAIARCRTSGVGVEDPDWVYVKMTFKF